MYQRLGEVQGLSGRAWRKEKLLLPPGFEPLTVPPVVCFCTASYMPIPAVAFSHLQNYTCSGRRRRFVCDWKAELRGGRTVNTSQISCNAIKVRYVTRQILDPCLKSCHYTSFASLYVVISIHPRVPNCLLSRALGVCLVYQHRKNSTVLLFSFHVAAKHYFCYVSFVNAKRLDIIGHGERDTYGV